MLGRMTTIGRRERSSDLLQAGAELGQLPGAHVHGFLDLLQHHANVLFVEPLVAEVHVTVPQQDATHLGRGALEGGEAQKEWDDGLAERLGQGEVLDAVVRLQVLGGDAAQHDGRQTHAALDLSLQRVGRRVHL